MRPQSGAATGYVPASVCSSDDHGHAERHLQRGEQFQALMRYLEACMITVGTIPTEHVNLEALLERFEVIDLGSHDFPERPNVALQRFCSGSCG